jgi:hypothetical protein
LNIGKIASLAAAGEIGLDEGADLVKFHEAFITARNGQDIETRLRQIEELVERHPPTVEMEIQGGNPVMPGHEDVRMPDRVIAIRPDKDTP